MRTKNFRDTISHRSGRGFRMGRIPMKRGRKYAIQELWEVHHEILRRLVLGQKSVDIARDLQISEAMVSYTKNSPISQRKLEIMEGARDADTSSAAAEIKSMVPDAVKLMKDVLVNPEDPMDSRLKVAFEEMGEGRRRRSASSSGCLGTTRRKTLIGLRPGGGECCDSGDMITECEVVTTQ